jgi:hypothetical protein
MCFHVHLYEDALMQGRQDLLHKISRERKLTRLPRRKGLGRRTAGRIGVLLVALGSRLEQFEQQGKPVFYDL